MGHLKNNVWAGLAVTLAMACSSVSRADTLNLVFAGPGVSGALTLTTAPDPHTGVWPPAASNLVDPAGSVSVSTMTGTFSDTTLGIVDATVSGPVGLNRVLAESTNHLAPYSFSLFTVTEGVDEGNGITSPGLHYDNLFYPGGSPHTASDYPYSGGLFDIYGLLFTLNTGETVNLWSNGDTPGGLNYGVAVTDGTTILHYTGGVALSAVPLPASAPLFGAALLALAVVGRGIKRVKAAA